VLFQVLDDNDYGRSVDWWGLGENILWTFVDE